jgi:hypothetical protein
MVIGDLPSSLEGLGGLVGRVAGLSLGGSAVGARPSTSVARDRARRCSMFCELEDRLYRSRDVFSSALTEYDDTRIRHEQK